ncbi:MAG: hypothetical protein HY721_27690 [Planctomycetes bacterium]|nr:hypothetical protein [Planctomycetota bacterium]
MSDQATQGVDAPLDPSVWKTGRKRRRSRARKVISRHLGYYCFRAAHAVVCRLPWSMGRGLAWLVGTAAYWLLTRERNTALQQLTRVYGAERTPAEIHVLAREVFRHTASVLIDWVILRRWSREELRARFPDVAGEIERLHQELARTSSGVVAITAHLGNWELLGHCFGLFAPGLLVTLAKRIYFERYQDFIHRLRTGHGLEVVYTDESARKVLRALHAGKLVAFLSDQDLRTNSGVFVEFFGLPAYTVTFPVEVALKTRTKLLFYVLVRTGKGFRVLRRGPFDLPQTGDKEADVLASTQLWTSILEEEVRRYPAQWTWIHARWRTMPDSPRRQWDHRLKQDRDREGDRDREED